VNLSDIGDGRYEYSTVCEQTKEGILSTEIDNIRPYGCNLPILLKNSTLENGSSDFQESEVKLPQVFRVPSWNLC
jgi:hypothetical protein